MSYGLKYRLSFDSVSGTPCEINILEAGYEGPVEKRNLGSAPVLKMDDGEAVRGTSLELSIETCFDGDLREFYTTDRKKFRVEVYRSGVLFWSGHSFRSCIRSLTFPFLSMYPLRPPTVWAY